MISSLAIDILAVINYLVPLFVIFVSFFAVHKRTKAQGNTKDLAIAIGLSMVYVCLHYIYMSGHRLPLFQEMPWRGWHLLMFYFPLHYALYCIRSSKKILANQINLKTVQNNS